MEFRYRATKLDSGRIQDWVNQVSIFWKLEWLNSRLYAVHDFYSPLHGIIMLSICMSALTLAIPHQFVCCISRQWVGRFEFLQSDMGKHWILYHVNVLLPTYRNLLCLHLALLLKELLFHQRHANRRLGCCTPECQIHPNSCKPKISDPSKSLWTVYIIQL